MENNGICSNYWKSPNTEATTFKKAKVTYFFFDLQFCMTIPLRGW